MESGPLGAVKAPAADTGVTYSTECKGAALRVRGVRRIGFGGNTCEERRFSKTDRTVMTDLMALFSELIRFETELRNAIDARLRADYDLPLSRFEPMQGSAVKRHVG